MKVLIINGSPRENGNTDIAIEEMTKVFGEEGLETEVVRVGNKAVRGCLACNFCATHEGCVFEDVLRLNLKYSSNSEEHKLLCTTKSL